jgi:hypothetical protein
MLSNLKKLWELIRGEPRDDYTDQFWAAFFRDSSDARPGCTIAGIIVVVLIFALSPLICKVIIPWLVKWTI